MLVNLAQLNGVSYSVFSPPPYIVIELVSLDEKGRSYECTRQIQGV
ncbi:predicted protein [Plenodomus lingam JN3]|uniref:Predicted protein n=1 Tax=Leptosphaeria maculans (strain JN3 / isolate v23.1.3 / race Av1-4-5-6-7-8) TaxID=985895 RepID=E5AA59_LEPMJ|nr:predicted protein [Plenodomus lingam JN3]CBY00550.1 predicted protein [Plenodomus lingam JN3]